MVHNADKNFTSSVFDYLKSVADPDRFVIGFKTPAIGTPRDRRHRFENSSIDSAIMDQLLVFYEKEDSDDGSEKKYTLENGMRLSVTSLEEFNQCHLRYMLHNVLRINERTDNTDVDLRSVGTLIHKMYEIGLSDINREDYLANAEKLLEDNELFEKNVNDVFEKAILAARLPGSLDDEGEREHQR